MGNRYYWNWILFEKVRFFLYLEFNVVYDLMKEGIE